MTTRGLFYIPASTPAQEHLKRVAKQADEERKKKANGPFQATIPTPTPGAPVNRALFQAGFPLGVAQRVEEPKPRRSALELLGGAELAQAQAAREQGKVVRKGLEVSQEVSLGIAGAGPGPKKPIVVPSTTRFPTDPAGRAAFEEAVKRGEIPPEGQEFRDPQREVVEALKRGEISIPRAAQRLVEVGRSASPGLEQLAGDIANPLYWVSTYAVPLRLARPLAATLAQAARRAAPVVGQAGREAALAPARLLTGAVGEGAGRLGGKGAANPIGREAIAYGPDPNKAYRMRYRLVEMDDLIPSHTDAFVPNPAYPAELQPRIRERGAARLGVERMARDLVPDAIIQDSQALDRGPMIIGPDRVVESGNGRMLALRLARQSYPERWQAYQQTLRDALPQFGIEEAQLTGMRNPVLVRERVSDVDRVRFAAEANQPAVAVFSPLENALQDAKRIRLDTLVVPEETQSLDVTLRARDNQSFVVGFLETLPANERASLIDATGDLNLLGVSRIKAAMFARTYPGEAGRRLTQIFFESREPLIRNIEEGMMASLPKVAQAEDLVRSGQRAGDLSIGEDLAASLDMLARVRQRKMSVQQYLGQAQMFQRELTPFQEQMLLHIEGLARSPRKVREFLGDYADRVIATPHPQQAAMFAGRQVTKEELFNATVRGQEQGPLFASAQEVPTAPAPETPRPGLVEEAPGIPEAQVAPGAKSAAAKAEGPVTPVGGPSVAAVPAGQARAPQAKPPRVRRAAPKPAAMPEKLEGWFSGAMSMRQGDVVLERYRGGANIGSVVGQTSKGFDARRIGEVRGQHFDTLDEAQRYVEQAPIAAPPAPAAAKPPRVRRAAPKPVTSLSPTEAMRATNETEAFGLKAGDQFTSVPQGPGLAARPVTGTIESIQVRRYTDGTPNPITSDLVFRDRSGKQRTIGVDQVSKPAEAPVAAEPAPGAAPSPAPSVPLLITREQRQALADMGMTRAQVDALTPQQAQDILSGAAPPPAPAVPVAAAAPPPVKPPVATGGVPPPGGGVPAQPPGIATALRQAKAITELQRPGHISALAGRVPVVSQVLDYIKPVRGMFQKGNEFLGQSWVGRSRVKSTLMTEANSTFVPLMNDLDRAFGKDATKGLPIPAARFTGTATERAPWSDTLYDIIQRPGLYQLTPEQTALLQRFHQRNIALLEKVNQEFGTEIGRFENPQGFFLPNKDVSEDALEVLETLGRSQRSALVSGQAKTRIFDTAFDRWKADPSFVPETNVRALTSAMDGFKASAAAAETFRAGIGGKNLMEVVELTHPQLLKLKQDLTQKVQRLRGRISTARAGITSSAQAQRRASQKLTATEARMTDLEERLADLGEEWGPELSFLSGELRQITAQAKTLGADVLAGRTRLTGQVGKALNLADELDDAVTLLDQVRRTYKAANLQGYTLVREGNLFRYFKADQAASVRQLLETSNNPALNFIENIRKTAFVADASPIVGVQAPLHWFAAPLQTSKDWIGGVVRGAQKGDILGAFKSEQLAKDIAANPQSYEDFSFYMGLELGGVPEEFSVGFLSKLPKIGRRIGVLNESMFNAVLRESKNHFDAHVANFLKDGMAPDQAKAMAAQMVRTVNPLWDPAAMGLSESRARLLRTPFTSVSFLLKPAELSANGISGMMKIGLGQAKKLTPQERTSTKILLTIVTSLTGLTVASAGINAVLTGKDPLAEILEVLDPQSGRWWTLSLGDRRAPIGGPFRSMFKTVVPSKYRELGDAPYPFNTFGRFAMGKMTPFLSTQLDLIRNKDYFGDPILKGKFVERLLRFAAYEIEGMVPLAIGAAGGALRTGQGLATAVEESAGQFLGTSLYRESPFQRRDAEVREWAKGQDITGIQGYSDLLPAVQKQFDTAFPETTERVKAESKRRREQRGDVPWLPVEAGELSERSWEEFYGMVDETNRQFLKAFPEAERLEVYLGVVGGTIGKLELSKPLRRRYQELVGQQALALLPLILQREVYQRAKDERKREMLQGVLSLAREQARAQMLPLLREQMAEETRQGVPPPTPTPTATATPFSQPSTPRSGGVLLVPVGAGR